MAPYFEIASDLGNELYQISNAINKKDSVYIQNKFGEDIDNSLAESIYGMTCPGAWKDLSARFIRDKLQFFVLKNYQF